MFPRRTGALLAAAVTGVVLTATAVPAAQAVTSPSYTANVLASAPAGTFKGGSSAAGVDSFLGIRYAKPPVGDLRWKAPVAYPDAPSGTVVDALSYGNRCPQLESGNGPASDTEDCLFINVQRPTGVVPGAKRPVFVWFHGGSFVNGSADQHEGSQFVTRTGALVVTMNFRLGVFGFLANGALTKESGESGNYGFQDEQEALRWVQRNIASFGGDPAKVTIGGESSGALAVCGHLASPGSKGLFSGAIFQSGVCESQTQKAAESAGGTFATAQGCLFDVAACLRKKSVSALLNGFGVDPRSFAYGTPTLPVDPDRAIATGNFNRVPVMIGGMLDEGRTFLSGFTLDPVTYNTAINVLFPPLTALQVKYGLYPYPITNDKWAATYQASRIIGDSGKAEHVGSCVTRRISDELAKYTPTYVYEFAHRDGPGLTPIAGYVWGAGHAADLPYVWPSFDNGTPIAPTFDLGEQQLSKDMTAYWGAFVANGNPAVWGQTSWPQHGVKGSLLQLQAAGASAPITDAQFTKTHNCSFWDSNS